MPPLARGQIFRAISIAREFRFLEKRDLALWDQMKKPPGDGLDLGVCGGLYGGSGTINRRHGGVSGMGAADGKIQDIQALRGIAIALVLAQHMSLTPTLLSYIPLHLNMPFYIGVDLFFVISGYVVTLSLLRGSIDVRKFLLRRAFRLWPAMAAFICFSALVLFVARIAPKAGWGNEHLISIQEFIWDAALTLTGQVINIRPSGLLYYFSAMWSLSVEFQFYIGYAALAAAALLIGRGRRTIAAVVYFTLAACIAYRLKDLLPSGAKFSSAVLDYLVVWRFDFMLAGCALAVAHLKGLGTPHIGRTGVVILLAFCIAVTAFCGSDLNPGLLVRSVDRPLLIVAFVLIIALASKGAGLSRRPLLWLGDRSYSVYLLHFPVMGLFWIAVRSFAPQLFSMGPLAYGAAQMIVCVPAALFLSDLSFRYIEHRFIDVGRRYIASAIPANKPATVT
jgi:peptidoglycan/LPS O-acetylase OafA/YrhL